MPVEGVPHEVVDLSDTRAAEAAVKRLVDGAGGTLDAVFTAAGTDKCGALVDVDGDDWDRVVMVNLLGTAAVVRASLPYLKTSGGKVVTVASTLGHRVFPDATAYCASKFGVVGFTRALQSELKGEVGVTLLTPGGMHTAFFDDRDEQYKPGPDAKLNRPEDVAAVRAARPHPAARLRDQGAGDRQRLGGFLAVGGPARSAPRAARPDDGRAALAVSVGRSGQARQRPQPTLRRALSSRLSAWARTSGSSRSVPAS